MRLNLLPKHSRPSFGQPLDQEEINASQRVVDAIREVLGLDPLYEQDTIISEDRKEWYAQYYERTGKQKRAERYRQEKQQEEHRKAVRKAQYERAKAKKMQAMQSGVSS